MLGAMKRKPKSPARPAVQPKHRQKKSRRRARRDPLLPRAKIGAYAGFAFSDAAQAWRERGELTECFVSEPGDDSKRRVKRRLGTRVNGTLCIGAAKKQRARRARRRKAVLSQEGRRRGLFRLSATAFGP